MIALLKNKTAYILLSFCVIICYSLKGQEETLIDKKDNGLLFVLFEIKKDSAQNSVVNLLEQKTVLGKRKTMVSQSLITGQYLKIEFCRGDSVIASEMLEHPLYKHIEYVDEDGKLSFKDVSLDSVEFFVRTPLIENLDKIYVVEALTNVPEKRIATIGLKK